MSIFPKSIRLASLASKISSDVHATLSGKDNFKSCKTWFQPSTQYGHIYQTAKQWLTELDSQGMEPLAIDPKILNQCLLLSLFTLEIVRAIHEEVNTQVLESYAGLACCDYQLWCNDTVSVINCFDDKPCEKAIALINYTGSIMGAAESELWRKLETRPDFEYYKGN